MSGVRVAFSLPVIILGIILIIYHFAKRIIREKELLFKGFKFIRVIICVGLIWFIGMEAVIVSYPKHNEKKDDYILVLGAGLRDGTFPTEILRNRLDAAIVCSEKNDKSYIVVSGGKGEDEDIPEAQAMSEYLQDKGVSKEKIIMENQSRNTNQNFKFSKEKIEEHSNKDLDKVNVKIVTTDFHAFRSSILAKRNGYVNFDNYSSSTVWYLIPITYTREAFAIVKSMIFDR
jgi:uncharacterized SAM-binding protein YcdF (DUF218 family)